MKKLILIFSTLVIVLSSCSSNDEAVNTPPTSSSVLVKKAIFESIDGNLTALYTYDGNKIVKTTISDGVSFEASDVYTYAGDLITKIEYFNDNVLYQKDIFTYDTDNKLISYISLSYDIELGTKSTYVYNADGTISVSVYNGNLTSQTELKTTEKIYFTNGEISKIDTFNVGVNIQNTTTYTYDTKNNPYKNITGFDKLGILFRSGFSHNLLTENDDISSDIVINQYIYNSNDYPSIQKRIINHITYTDQYFY